MELKKGDRLEDLQNGYFIIQNDDYFSFGTDAVLLSHFVDLKKGERVVDFCTGCGIIPILLAARQQGAYITGIEIQQSLAKMAQRSVDVNDIGSIDIVCGDIKKIQDYVKYGVDAVVVNPPYEKADAGKHNENESINIAKREVMCTLEDVVVAANKILRTGGRLYMIHRTERLPEIMACMCEKKLEPKRIRLVAQRLGKAPNFVLVEARKGARQGAEVLPTLYVYAQGNEYTDEVKKIYGIGEES